ncbi:MAG TPA: DUF1206 domain-containing protein [Actinophytocola sp.]|jgi:hypothetical protein|uniref:DUF1206 domain-containing protein n=1 Tax=Actinophytocola sp. TaxID=1872138 RepID=UPI002F95FF39
MQALGRAGIICYGIVHLLVAYLAARVAFGDTAQQADQRGAIEEIGSTAMGGFLLWVLAVGLFAFAGWQLLMAAKGYQWVLKKSRRTRKRIGSAARAVIGVALGVTAVRYASGSGSSGSSSDQQQTLTAKLLALPAGPFIVVAVGVAIIAVAIATAVKGFSKSFLEDLDMTDLPRGSQQWVRRLGVFGYVAKGVTFGIVGVLICVAGFNHDPKEAGGLDAALKTLAAQPFGTVLLCIVALGLAAFGVYCFAAAKAHKT